MHAPSVAKEICFIFPCAKVYSIRRTEGVFTTLEELRSLLKEHGALFQELPMQHGTQVRCKSGEIFSVYDTGKVVFGGKAKDPTLTNLVKSRVDPGGAMRFPAAQAAVEDAIFIVYGHDTQVR